MARKESRGVPWARRVTQLKHQFGVLERGEEEIDLRLILGDVYLGDDVGERKTKGTEE